MYRNEAGMKKCKKTTLLQLVLAEKKNKRTSYVSVIYAADVYHSLCLMIGLPKRLSLGASRKHPVQETRDSEHTGQCQTNTTFILGLTDHSKSRDILTIGPLYCS